MTQRFEGKNLEEALDAAAQGFGVQRYQLTYHVVLEKRGFLGGMKRVVVEAEVNQSATEPNAPIAASSPAVDRAPQQRDRGERSGRGGRGGRGARGGRGRDDRGNRGGGGGNRRGREEDLKPGDFEDFAADDVPAPEQGAETEAASSVRLWCEQAIGLAKLDLQARSEENDTQIIIRLYGRDGRRMTDRHGELLDAFQVLANKALTGRKIEKDIELDCLEFKGKRTEDLEQRAKRMADQVRRDGREQLLPAMTPIERRIVHLALQNDGEVTTESRGDGFYKRVAIIRRPPQQEQSSTPS